MVILEEILLVTRCSFEFFFFKKKKQVLLTFLFVFEIGSFGTCLRSSYCRPGWPLLYLCVCVYATVHL